MPMHLVKSMLVQKAKAVTMKTVMLVMPAASNTDSVVYLTEMIPMRTPYRAATTPNRMTLRGYLRPT